MFLGGNKADATPRLLLSIAPRSFRQRSWTERKKYRARFIASNRQTIVKPMRRETRRGICVLLGNCVVSNTWSGLKEFKRASNFYILWIFLKMWKRGFSFRVSVVVKNRSSNLQVLLDEIKFFERRRNLCDIIWSEDFFKGESFRNEMWKFWPKIWSV